MTKQEIIKMKEKIKNQLEVLLKEGQEPVKNTKDFDEYKFRVDKFLDSAFIEFEQAVREETIKECVEIIKPLDDKVYNNNITINNIKTRLKLLK